MKKNIKQQVSKKIMTSRRGLFLVLGLFLIAVIAIWLSGQNKKIVHQASSTVDLSQDFNVEVGIPPKNVGNLNDVPKEELDSLFANIK
jgi:cbb3-type cytochrome oxidase subunit 3